MVNHPTAAETFPPLHPNPPTRTRIRTQPNYQCTGRIHVQRLTTITAPTVMKTVLQHLHSNLSAIFTAILASCGETEDSTSHHENGPSREAQGYSAAADSKASLCVPYGRHYAGVIKMIMLSGFGQSPLWRSQVRLDVDARVAHTLAVGAHLCYFNTDSRR